MMMTRHVGTRLLAPVFLSVACGCCSSPLHVSESVFPGNLVGDAHRTYAAYVKAADGTGEQTETEIPREYWVGRLKTLNPVKVYTHKTNVVVVQSSAEGIEVGKYICIPVSSYVPEPGDDGFEFTSSPRSGATHSLGDGVLEFKRSRGR